MSNVSNRFPKGRRRGELARALYENCGVCLRYGPSTWAPLRAASGATTDGRLIALWLHGRSGRHEGGYTRRIRTRRISQKGQQANFILSRHYAGSVEPNLCAAGLPSSP